MAAGCEEPAEDLEGGACFHDYREAVLHVEAALDADTLEPIEEVWIRDVTVNGNAQDLGRLAAGAGDRLEHDPVEMLLVCSVPCAMGVEEGTWVFTAQAEGYAAAEVSVVAEYEEFVGGCPSFNDGGTRVAIEISAD